MAQGDLHRRPESLAGRCLLGINSHLTRRGHEIGWTNRGRVEGGGSQADRGIGPTGAAPRLAGPDSNTSSTTDGTDRQAAGPTSSRPLGQPSRGMEPCSLQPADAAPTPAPARRAAHPARIAASRAPDRTGRETQAEVDQRHPRSRLALRALDHDRTQAPGRRREQGGATVARRPMTRLVRRSLNRGAEESHLAHRVEGALGHRRRSSSKAASSR